MSIIFHSHEIERTADLIPNIAEAIAALVLNSSMISIMRIPIARREPAKRKLHTAQPEASKVHSSSKEISLLKMDQNWGQNGARCPLRGRFDNY